jgi:hypothetical protein
MGVLALWQSSSPKRTIYRCVPSGEWSGRVLSRPWPAPPAAANLRLTRLAPNVLLYEAVLDTRRRPRESLDSSTNLAVRKPASVTTR